MRKIISTAAMALACTALWAAGVLAQQVDVNSAAWLLGQVRAGEALYRDDVVQSALARLYRVAPARPEGLAAELRMALRQGDHTRAEHLLAQLRDVAPGSAALRHSELLMTLSGSAAQEQLHMARLYAAAGRTEEALKIYDDLLQGVYPSLELAFDYWLLRSRDNRTRAAAIQRLEALDQEYPRNIPLRQALVSLYFSENRHEDALTMLHALAKEPRAREDAATREYAFLVTLPATPQTLDKWRTYLRLYPGTSQHANAIAHTRKLEDLMRDPAWMAGLTGMELLERGRHRDALAALRQAAQAYPEDGQIAGSLGLAYQRAGQRQLAQQYYTAAIRHERDHHRIARWVDLEKANRYWLLLNQADTALQAGRLSEARALFQQARTAEPGHAFALLGLGHVALAGDDMAGAERHYLQARRLDPADAGPVRALMRLYRSQSDEKTLAFLDSLPPAMQRHYADVRRAIALERLLTEAQAALDSQDWDRAARLMTEARRHQPDDAWLAYRLAGALQQLARPADAEAVFADLLQRQGQAHQTTARYAHALFLSSRDEDAQALQTLAAIDAAAWTPEMHTLAERLRQQQRLAQARALRAAGQEPQAVALLKAEPATPAIELTLASWALARGDHPEAQRYYTDVLARDPNHADARLGRIETWLESGQPGPARLALVNEPPQFAPEDINSHRRLANAWVQAGDRSTGTRLLSRLVQRQTEPDALLHRDYARLMQQEQPQTALDHYALAMRDADMLAAPAAQPRDNHAFTRATRPQADDDWLRSSIRSGAAETYQQINPTVTLQHDFALRTDGTPGYSRVRNHTTMLHGERPLWHGRAFVRAEQIFLDAGSFTSGPAGTHSERFGHCAALVDGCRSHLRQRTHGTSLAVGWAGERLAVDIGVTPLGFERTNIVGGITYSGKLAAVGWSLTASRRPMTNSLLSYAGAVDPVSGQSWGGVTANGVTLGLSWDQGGAHGVWASLGHHKLRGHNVMNNSRTRLMGGYYHRLINRTDETLSIGVNSMLWHYAKDLGDYSFGQGGYYSPQRYFSLSLPVSYARRTQDWSFLIDGSVSWSHARSSRSLVYPLGDPASRLPAFLLDPQAGRENEAGSSRGFGYSLRAVGERRLSSHTVVGVGIALQKSKDYTPSRAFLYLRHSFQPWQGSMPLPPQTLTPHGDWR